MNRPPGMELLDLWNLILCSRADAVRLLWPRTRWQLPAVRRLRKFQWQLCLVPVILRGTWLATPMVPRSGDVARNWASGNEYFQTVSIGMDIEEKKRAACNARH